MIVFVKENENVETFAGCFILLSAVDRMAARSIWRYGAKLAVAATALGGGAALASSDDPATALKLCTAVPVRLVRDSVTAASIAFGIHFILFVYVIEISEIICKFLCYNILLFSCISAS